MFNNFSSPNNNILPRKEWLREADRMLATMQGEDSENLWGKSFSSTSALLQQAHDIIAQSEQRIAELERISSTDELTGITNRRGLMRELDRELDRVNRDKSQGGLLIIIDLDNFKTINDTHGHAVGDMALKIVASTLSNDIRKMDIVARLGGDEFVIIFSNTTRQNALERAQFIIKKLNSLSFVHQGHEIEVRASLGLREYKKGCKASKIFDDADTNMYENKQQIKDLGLRKQNRRMV